MPEEKDRLIEAVAKMIRLTQSKGLLWKAEKQPEVAKEQPDDQISSVFSIDYEGKKLRLYERTFKAYRGPFDLPGIMRGTPEVYWDSIVVLEFLGQQDEPLWRFPTIGPLKDLLSAVQYQVADVAGFLDAVLGNGDKKTRSQ